MKRYPVYMIILILFLFNFYTTIPCEAGTPMPIYKPPSPVSPPICTPPKTVLPPIFIPPYPALLPIFAPPGSISTSPPKLVNPLNQMIIGGYGWNEKGLPGVSYVGDGSDGVIDGRHNGVDLKATAGTSVKAPEEGYITKATYDKAHGQLTLEMVGKSGNIYKFVHMENNTELMKAIMEKGFVRIEAGHELGVVGNAEGDKWATGPHLHMSVMENGKFVDPGTLFKIN